MCRGAQTPAHVITVSPIYCPPASPNDTTADDDGVQCLVAQGGTIKLAPSRPDGVDNGYIMNTTGIDIVYDATKIYPAPGTRMKTRLKAAATFANDIILRSENVGGLELVDLIFDGNRDARNWAAICTAGYRPNVSMVEIWNGNAFFVSNSEFRRSPCGAALAVSGYGYTIESNLFEDNGTGRTDYYPSGTEPWADGIRVESCHGRMVNGVLQRGQIMNNTFRDSTDLSLSIGGTSDCTISGNYMVQVNRFAFGGIGFHNVNHPGTTMSNNTIEGNNKMSIGISIGGNPWCITGMGGGASITGNTISGAYYGMNVQDSTHTISGNNILNYVNGGACDNGTITVKAHCNVHNSSNMQACTTTTNYDLDWVSTSEGCCGPPV